MKKEKILFSKIMDVFDVYAPKPASKFIPNWYKEIESRIPEEKNPNSSMTIKKCIPVFDSITAGYIIISPCDVYVSIVDEEPVYQSSLPNIINFHPRKQAYNHPDSNIFSYPKWINPWSIKTPNGWSCYFKPPAHNPNPWFKILEGIVDTDKYISPVNFPFVLLDPKKECLIPAGTPIAQVIPIKRINWEMEFIDNNKNIKDNSIQLNSKFFDRYKSMFWTKKEYK